MRTSNLRRQAWLGAVLADFLLWAAFATTIVSPLVIDDEVMRSFKPCGVAPGQGNVTTGVAGEQVVKELGGTLRCMP